MKCKMAKRRRKRQFNRQEAQDRFNREWDAKGYAGEKATSAERMAAQGEFDRRWDQKEARNTQRVIQYARATHGSKAIRNQAAAMSSLVWANENRPKDFVNWSPKEQRQFAARYLAGDPVATDKGATQFVRSARDTLSDLQDVARDYEQEFARREREAAEGNVLAKSVRWLQGSNDAEDGSAFTAFRRTAFAPLMSLASGSLDAIEENIYAPWSHNLAAAATFANPQSEAFGDWSDARDATEGVSPGQALAVNPLWNNTVGLPVTGVTEALASRDSAITTAEGKETVILHGQEVSIAELLRSPEQLDPADPEERRVLREIMEGSWVGRYSSGSADFALAIVADPLVAVGKGLKTAKLFTFGSNVLTPVERSARLMALDDLRAAGSDLASKADAVFAKPSAKEVIPDGPLVKRTRDRATYNKVTGRAKAYRNSLDQAVTRLAEMDDYGAILRDSWVRSSANPEGLAFYVKQAKSRDEIIDMMAVHLGDERTIMRLQQETPATLDALLAARGLQDQVAAGADPLKIAKVDSLAAQRPWLYDNYGRLDVAALDSVVSDLARRDEMVAQLVGRPDEKIGGEFFGGIVGSSNAASAPSISRFELIDRVRLNRAEKKGSAVVDTIRRGPMGVPINVVRWGARQSPSNVLRIAGNSAEGSGVQEWIAHLNSATQYDRFMPGLKAQVAREMPAGTSSSVIKNEAYRRMTGRKQEFLQRYIEAAAKGDTFLRDEVTAMQREMMEDFAAHKADLWVGPKPLEPKKLQIPENAYRGLKPFRFETPKDVRPDYDWVTGVIDELRREFVKPIRKADYTDLGKLSSPDAVAARELAAEAKADLKGRRTRKEVLVDKHGQLAANFENIESNAKLAADRERNKKIDAALASFEKDYTFDKLNYVIDTFMKGASKEQIAKLKALRSEARIARKQQWAELKARRIDAKEVNKRLSELHSQASAGLLTERQAMADAQKVIDEVYLTRKAKWEAQVAERDAWVEQFLGEFDNHQKMQQQRIQEVIDRKGYWVENGDVYTAPQYETHLADAMPLIDWNRINYLSDSPSFNKALKRTGYTVSAVWGKIQEAWRMSVLFRAGYTTRNVLEGNLRALAVVGAAQLDPQSVANLPQGAARKSYIAARKVSGGARRDRARVSEIHSTVAEYNKLQDDARAIGPKLDGVQKKLEKANPGTEKAINLTKRQAELEAKLAGLRSRIADLDARGNMSDMQAELAMIDARLDRMLEPIPRASNKQTNVAGVKFDGLTGDPSTKDTMNTNLSGAGTNRYASGLAVDDAYKRHARQFQQLNVEVKPTDSNYFVELANIYNNTLRGSDLARLRLRHAEADEVIATFRKPQSAPMRKLAELNGIDWRDSEALIAWVTSGADSLDKLVPTADLRRKLLAGKRVSPEELRGSFGTNAGAPSIIGAQMMFEHGAYPRLQGKWRNVVDTAWNYLATIPEDKLVRTPYANAVYNRTLQGYAQTMAPEFIAANRAQLQRNAQRTAIRALKRDQFTIERYSNFGKVMENFSPFITAKLNSARFWGRAIVNDPSVLARGFQIWGLPEDMHMADENGVFHLPLSLPKAIGDNAPDAVRSLPFIGDKVDNWRTLKDTDTLTFTKDGILSIIASPNPGLIQVNDDGQVLPRALPGLASLVTPDLGGLANVPVQAALRRYAETGDVSPIMEGVIKVLAPYGLQDDVFNAMLPAWARDVRTVLDSESTAERREATQLRVQHEMYKEWLEAGRPAGMEPTPEKVAERVDALLSVKILGSLTMPAAVKVKTALDPIIDYRNLLYDTGLAPEAVEWAVATKFGEDATVLLRGGGVFSSKELPRTMATVKYLRENAAEIEQITGGNIEEIKILLGSRESLEGAYNPLAAQIIAGMEIPGTGGRTFGERMNFTEAQAELDMSRGRKEWDSYKVWKNNEFAKANAKLGPGEKLPREFWKRINYVEAAVIEKMREVNPTYVETYQLGADNPKRPMTATKVLRNTIAAPSYERIKSENPRFWESVEVFLEARDQAQAELNRAGISDVKDPVRKVFDSKENLAEVATIEEVKAKLDAKVLKLKRKSVKFGDMWDLYFRGDDFASRFYGAKG